MSIEQMATNATTVAFYYGSLLVEFIRRYVKIEGRPIDIIKPHITKKLHIRFVIDINPSYFHNRPIVDLAPSI